MHQQGAMSTIRTYSNDGFLPSSPMQLKAIKASQLHMLSLAWWRVCLEDDCPEGTASSSLTLPMLQGIWEQGGFP